MTFVGTAGWAISRQYRIEFPDQGSHLQRYTTRLNCAEINSSFYQSHRRTTYQRWADSVTEDFRFSVKLPRNITQHRRLNQYGNELDYFLEEASGLGPKLGVLLVQLPPSLAYVADVVEAFFRDLSRSGITMACEPRHASWFSKDADTALKRLDVIRVAADPPRASSDGKPGGARRISYFRLHGSPKTYYSEYIDSELDTLTSKLGPKDWCIFDNTAAFHALGNALALRKRLHA